MASILADTHALIWYLQGSNRLSATAKEAIVAAIASGSALLLASISVVEIVFLNEKQRIDVSVLPQVLSLIRNPTSVSWSCRLRAKPLPPPRSLVATSFRTYPIDLSPPRRCS